MDWPKVLQHGFSSRQRRDPQHISPQPPLILTWPDCSDEYAETYLASTEAPPCHPGSPGRTALALQLCLESSECNSVNHMS